jgi:hypothetical protein
MQWAFINKTLNRTCISMKSFKQVWKSEWQTINYRQLSIYRFIIDICHLILIYCWYALHWIHGSYNWAALWQNQQSVSATSMDPDQPGHPCSLIRIHAVCLQTLLQVEKQTINSVDPKQTAWMHRLVWIRAGRKPTMLVLSWRDSINVITGNSRHCTYL